MGHTRTHRLFGPSFAGGAGVSTSGKTAVRRTPTKITVRDSEFIRVSSYTRPTAHLQLFKLCHSEDHAPASLSFIPFNTEHPAYHALKLFSKLLERYLLLRS